MTILGNLFYPLRLPADVLVASHRTFEKWRQCRARFTKRRERRERGRMAALEAARLLLAKARQAGCVLTQFVADTAAADETFGLLFHAQQRRIAFQLVGHPFVQGLHRRPNLRESSPRVTVAEGGHASHRVGASDDGFRLSMFESKAITPSPAPRSPPGTAA